MLRNRARVIKRTKTYTFYSDGSILIPDIYDYQELLSLLPYGAQDTMHIYPSSWGYLHDVSAEVILEPIKNGEEPKGWETLEKDFREVCKYVFHMWKINAEYGYR